MNFKKIFSDTSKTKTEKNIVDILFELKINNNSLFPSFPNLNPDPSHHLIIIP